jgi:carboxymethylenebutenolidase
MEFLNTAVLCGRRSLVSAKFLRSAALVICGIAAGNFMVASNALAAPPKPAQTEAVDAQMTKFSSGDASVAAYLAKPKDAGKHAAVIVVHDSGGLNDDTKELTRRFAEAGFVALAPDLAFRTGEPKTVMENYAAIGKVPLVRPVEDMKAAFSFLQQDSAVDGAKISVVGIGWGGWRAFKLAEETPSLSHAVIFYGQTPSDENLTKIKMPVLVNYAQYDFHVTGNAIWTEDQIGKNLKYYVYTDTDRGFFVAGGPGSPAQTPGNVAGAKLAWTRTLEFLKH